jgi:glycosyltransferase involved in cell wall biosynthesis
VDIEFVNSFKKEANIKHNSIRLKVFYGGSFGDKDGIIFLLRGFEMACESNSNIELILTGKISNQMNGIVQRLIAESQWNMRIKYLGCIPTEEYFETMVNSDILCMTRINTTFAKSGFPFKLGEYLASGNAIISTDVGDVSKYIVNRHNAILINPGSEVEICDAIILLCQDSQLRTRIGIAGKETASKYFSTNLVSDILWKNLLQLK